MYVYVKAHYFVCQHEHAGMRILETNASGWTHIRHVYFLWTRVHLHTSWVQCRHHVRVILNTRWLKRRQKLATASKKEMISAAQDVSWNSAWVILREVLWAALVLRVPGLSFDTPTAEVTNELWRSCTLQQWSRGHLGGAPPF